MVRPRAPPPSSPTRACVSASCNEPPSIGPPATRPPTIPLVSPSSRDAPRTSRCPTRGAPVSRPRTVPAFPPRSSPGRTPSRSPSSRAICARCAPGPTSWSPPITGDCSRMCSTTRSRSPTRRSMPAPTWSWVTDRTTHVRSRCIRASRFSTASAASRSTRGMAAWHTATGSACWPASPSTTRRSWRSRSRWCVTTNAMKPMSAIRARTRRRSSRSRAGATSSARRSRSAAAR